MGFRGGLERGEVVSMEEVSENPALFARFILVLESLEQFHMGLGQALQSSFGVRLPQVGTG